MNAKGLGMVTPKVGAMTPRFSCAECGEPITDARRAGVVWKGDPYDGLSHDIRILCKARCLNLPKYRHAPDWPYWEELERFLMDLLFNTGLWSGKLRTAIRDTDEQHGVETARGER